MGSTPIGIETPPSGLRGIRLLPGKGVVADSGGGRVLRPDGSELSPLRFALPREERRRLLGAR